MPAMASKPPAAIGLAQLGDRAIIAVGGALAGQASRQVLAEDIRRALDDLAGLLTGPEAGREDHDEVLDALRQLGHAALAVGQAELVLGHDVADLQPAALEARGGELGVRGQSRRDPGNAGRSRGVSASPTRHFP